MTESDVIRKVQGLLAKAESTEFEAEREAFYAKAQDLMTRHAIDEALLDRAGRKAEVKPTSEVFVYTDNQANRPPKRNLLTAVARANRVRVVYYNGSKKEQKAMLVGFADDLEYVKLVYTSLYLQGHREGGRAYLASDRYASRVVYLTNFLLGFASKVDERLRAQNRKTEEAVKAETGTSTALVLVDRTKAVDDHVGELFPNLSNGRRVRIGYARGAHGAGQAAGAKADLSGGRGAVGGNRGALGR